MCGHSFRRFPLHKLYPYSWLNHRKPAINLKPILGLALGSHQRQPLCQNLSQLYTQRSTDQIHFNNTRQGDSTYPHELWRLFGFWGHEWERERQRQRERERERERGGYVQVSILTGPTTNCSSQRLIKDVKLYKAYCESVHSGTKSLFWVENKQIKFPIPRKARGNTLLLGPVWTASIQRLTKDTEAYFKVENEPSFLYMVDIWNTQTGSYSTHISTSASVSTVLKLYKLGNPSYLQHTNPQRRY